MTLTEEGGGEPPKLLARSAVKIRIALASGLVLGLGSWLAPRAAQTTPSTVPQEHAAPLLEEQVQLRETSRTFVGVQDVAADVRDHSVAIAMPDLPPVASRNDFSELLTAPAPVSGYGVFVSATHVLTHSAALDGRSSVALAVGPDVTQQAQVVAYEPQTGLVLLQTDPSERTSATLAMAAPPAGALAVGVGRSRVRDLAIPVFVTGVGADRYTIGAVDESIPAGMPVFTLAGELFAVAAPEGGEVRAIPVRDAADRLLARASSGERRPSLGLAYQEPAGPLRGIFGGDGVVVTDVLTGGPADMADVRVGDLLVAVGDTPIDSADSATKALSATVVGMATPLHVRRAARARTIEVTPALAYEVAALARARDDRPSGLEARAILPPAVVETSAIPPSARVLSVNGRAVTSRPQVQRELRAARGPVPVLLEQAGGRYFVAIEPAR
jgi:membrane-associated protease RseP (regulator of RpoE activity)